MTDPRLVVPAEERTWLLDAFARGLAPGEVILRLVDTYRENGRHTLQLPLDPAAEVLFHESPRVEPDGATDLVSYVRARDSRTIAATVRDGTVEAAEPRVVPACRSFEDALQ